MMHRAWSSIVEVPYCFSRSYVKFQGHTALKIVKFDPIGAFPDSNSSLNSPMAMKCCTKLETAKERCPIVFQGHPSNFKVTRDKTSLILTQIGRFRTIGRSQLSNPSDLPCFSSNLVCQPSWCWIYLKKHENNLTISVSSELWDDTDSEFHKNIFAIPIIPWLWDNTDKRNSSAWPTGIDLFYKISTMAADARAACITKRSAASIWYKIQ